MVAIDFFFSPLVTTFLIGITTLVLLLWYSSRRHSYWKKKGVKYVKPFPLVGSVLENILNNEHEVQLQRHRTLGSIYGHYEGLKPLISVADPKLLRGIFLKDFHYFSNRRSFVLGDRVLDNMLVNIGGEDWRRVRTIVSPAFSTGKLKRMLNIFSECSMTLVNNFKAASEKGQPIHLKRSYGAMVMDIIASSAFSTKIESHNDPENEFVLMARKIFDPSFTWKFVLLIVAPRLMKFLKIPFFDPTITNFFRNAIFQIIDERKRMGQTRNDFLQLLIDTVKEVSKEEDWEEEKDTELVNNYGQEVAGQKVFKNSVTKDLSMDELVAQCIIFFMAGYEPTASTLSFATYFLALNEDVQERARQDIKDSLKESEGELTYAAVQNMKYVDNVISETLRICPPSIRIERKADDDYELGDTGITITKGMIVSVPTYALHWDPKYFPNPEKFDPDRFTAEERFKRDPYTYLPFGAGPRNCVGMRFALLEAKIGLIHVISHFNIRTCPETTIPLKLSSAIGLLQPKDIFLSMEPRSDCPIK